MELPQRCLIGRTRNAFHPQGYFCGKNTMSMYESVEYVWIIWLGCMAAFVMLTWRLIVRHRLRVALDHLLSDESGAVYVLSVVMVLPFYVLLICFILETTLMLVVKLGVSYSAFSAARAAIVWDLPDTPFVGTSGLPLAAIADSPTMSRKATEAAQLAMVPFASGSPLHSGPNDKEARDYLDAFHRWAPKSSAKDPYLSRKFQYASQATQTSIERDQSAGMPGLLKASVSYEYPFHIAPIGRLFGATRSTTGRAFLVYRITSTCVLPSEAPQNPERSLGIDYFPD